LLLFVRVGAFTRNFLVVPGGFHHIFLVAAYSVNLVLWGFIFISSNTAGRRRGLLFFFVRSASYRRLRCVKNHPCRPV